jgi:protein SCO1/2
MKNLQKLQTRLKTDTTLLINSFTVDPESDSVTQLKEYAIRFQYDLHNWNLLTGAKKDIYRLARNSFDVAATDGDGGETDFIHSEQIILVDKQLRIRGYYKGTDETQVDQLANDIKKLENEKD